MHARPLTSRLTLAVVVAALWTSIVGAPGVADETGDVAFDSGLQWHLERIGIPDAWASARGDGVVIAVVDSGVNPDHEDLRGQVLEGIACQGTGGDATGCAGSPTDDEGHGTHVAGIAAARTGNGLGVAGTAPGARILPVKVLFRPCPTCGSSGDPGDVVAAIRWAVDQGADIVNLSLGSTTSTLFGPGFLDAIDDAWSRGTIPVVAAGNDLVQTLDLDDAPAVVVAATDRDDGRPPYSHGVGNARWAVAAPGGSGGDDATSCSRDGRPLGILSTYWAIDDPTSAYACLSGTSMAAPQVSGVLALLLSAGASPAQAVDALLASAVDIGEAGRDAAFGVGRVDAARAMQVAAAGAWPASTQIAPASNTGGTGSGPLGGGTTPVLGTAGSGEPADTGNVLATAIAAVLIAAVTVAHVARLRRR